MNILSLNCQWKLAGKKKKADKLNQLNVLLKEKKAKLFSTKNSGRKDSD